MRGQLFLPEPSALRAEQIVQNTRSDAGVLFKRLTALALAAGLLTGCTSKAGATESPNNGLGGGLAAADGGPQPNNTPSDSPNASPTPDNPLTAGPVEATPAVPIAPAAGNLVVTCSGVQDPEKDGATSKITPTGVTVSGSTAGRKIDTIVDVVNRGDHYFLGHGPGAAVSVPSSLLDGALITSVNIAIFPAGGEPPDQFTHPLGNVPDSNIIPCGAL